VRFLGHGVGDQLGPVCAPEDAESAALALRPALDLRAGRWDVLLADRLPGSDRWVTRGPGAVLRRESSPVLPLDHAGWDAYLATRSANFRQQLRRRERALARDHDLRYRLTESPEELAADLEELFSLHARRWARSPVPSAFSGSALEFHRELAAVALERGWLRLWTMELDGRPAAAWYGFRFGGVESYYQAGRDPDREHGSIGLVLLAHSVRAALEDGMREYRFLRGGEDFKRRFTDSDPAVVTVALARTMAGRASVAAGAALAAPRGRAARRMVRRATSLTG
jgi:CelD/BcsL family acetyltransferase involved in cellulose biosynthesis